MGVMTKNYPELVKVADAIAQLKGIRQREVTITTVRRDGGPQITGSMSEKVNAWTVDPVPILEGAAAASASFKPSNAEEAVLHAALAADLTGIGSRFVPTMAEQHRKLRDALRAAGVAYPK